MVACLFLWAMLLRACVCGWLVRMPFCTVDVGAFDTLSLQSHESHVCTQWGLLSVEWVSRAALQHLPAAVADAMVSGFMALHFGIDVS